MNDEYLNWLRNTYEYKRAVRMGIDVLSGKVAPNDAEMMQAIDRLVALRPPLTTFDTSLTDWDRDFLRTNRIQP